MQMYFTKHISIVTAMRLVIVDFKEMSEWGNEWMNKTGRHSCNKHFSLFSHTAWMLNETDAKKTVTDSPLGNWRRPPKCPSTTWMNTIQQQQDLKSNNLSLNEAIDMAQNGPLWRPMSTFGFVSRMVTFPDGFFPGKTFPGKSFPG